ncbi:MAG: hypothetical protein KGR25_09350, partial [Chloroflexi bacterium]|nr:hypothetical protein [Chloroflexota bacterium]
MADFNRVSEFDKNVHVVNQPASSLQIGARLQGRRASDPPERFQQPVNVVLMRSNAPAPRLLTPGGSDHNWTFAPVDASGNATTTFSFSTATASPTFGTSSQTGCDPSWGPVSGGLSNVVLASATYGFKPCQISSIEPGTYDVYVKGQSSVGVLVTNVPFLPGQFRTISDLILREGDIVTSSGEGDRVNITDFTAFSAAYNGYPSIGGDDASLNWNAKADLNQSGYIDILDFSLLATNYGASTATSVPTINSTIILDASLADAAVSGAPTTHTVSLGVDGSDVVKRAVVSVRPTNASATVTCGSNTACTSAGAGVTLAYTGTSADDVEIGTFVLNTITMGQAGVTIRLDEAEGASGANRAFFRADELSDLFEVLPDVSWTLNVAPVAGHDDQFSAEVVLTSASTIAEGTATITYPPALTPTCDDVANLPGDVDCSVSVPGEVSFEFLSTGINASAGFPLGKVFFTIGSNTSDGQIKASVTGLTSDDASPVSLQNGVIPNGTDTRTFTRGGTEASPTVTASRVRTAAVRARSTSPNANLWVRTDATDIKAGDVIPVTVGVTTGTRAIDGAQLVLRTGSGVQIVDRDGNPVTSAGALNVTTGGALPSLLHRALDAGRGLIELAFGRQVNQSISGVSGEATLGTIYLKVTGAPSGDLLTIERQGTGQFATVVAGDGDDLTGSLIGLSTIDAVNAPVDTVPVAGAPIVGGTPGSNFTAPAAAPAPSRAAAPARSGAAATSATARPSIAMSRSLIEDRARGTITLSVPGRTPVELRTGTLSMAPDQYCPVLRHQAYIRLEDVGIAGATFGVEPGGVLSWVSPD